METDNALPFTGERIVTELNHHVGTTEHLHRYALALKYCADKVVLDIACGEGYGSHLISKVARRTFGVDISAESISHACTKYQKKNLTFLEGSADHIPLETNCVDIVVSFETLEHHDKHDEMFLEVKRVLKPDGILIISSPEKAIYHMRDAENPFHIKEITITELKALTARHFKFSKYLFQKHIHGSMIVPERCADGKNTLEIYSGNYYALEKGLSEEYPFYNRSFFNLAIASDVPVDDCPTTFFDGADVAQNQMASHQEALRKVYNTSSYRIGNRIVNALKTIKFIITLFFK